MRTTERGFDLMTHDVYPPDGTEARVVQTSSAVGEYDDSLDRPGSSFLWVGKDHHLNREEVAQLRDALTRWLETGRLLE
jgi:hypothetical protein